jgi:hypothetical protein
MPCQIPKLVDHSSIKNVMLVSLTNKKITLAGWAETKQKEILIEI